MAQPWFQEAKCPRPGGLSFQMEKIQRAKSFAAGPGGLNAHSDTKTSMVDCGWAP